MHIVHVLIQVKPEFIDTFKALCIENARSSRKEPGVVRFDVIQQIDDPTCFLLNEVYRSLEDSAKHKETAHYNKWRELAEPLMAQPRTRRVFQNIYPGDQDW